MVEKTTFNGRSYQRYDQPYFKRSSPQGPRYLHRDIWEAANGPIPDGWHVHHRDGDPSNNAVENLECVSPKDHASRHEWSDERKIRQRAHLDKIRPLTVAWHSSPAGRALHQENGKKARDSFQPKEKSCDQCSATFLTRGYSDRFCSNACKSAFRYQSGVDDVDRTCVVCGSVFRINRYRKTPVCGRSCANRNRSRKC